VIGRFPLFGKQNWGALHAHTSPFVLSFEVSMPEIIDVPRPRIITDAALVSRILDDHHLKAWPGNLNRFDLFRRGRDPEGCAYRAVTWEPQNRQMHVMKILADSTPTKGAVFERWDLAKPKDDLSDAYRVQDTLTPVELSERDKNIEPYSPVGMERRKSILEAFCFVQVEYEGNPLKLFNSFVLSDERERKAALEYVCRALQQPDGYKTYIQELFYRYVFFGAAFRAMAKLTTRQGGPGVARVGVNARRPGPKTLAERQAIARQKVTGEEPPHRRGPCRPLDITKFVQALEEFHIELKQSLTMTYASMVAKFYKRWPKRLVPNISQFYRHCRENLLEQGDAERKRFGPRLTAQYAKARIGQAVSMTFGFNLEVVDVDGFVAKLPVAAMVDGKVEPVYVTIMFAVSRRTGAVVGYEIAMNHENSEAFRRCIASVHISKAERARELGLTDTKGLLHGNIDAVYVDNAGMTKEVIEVACKGMGLIPFVAPPARGDLKAVGESLNNVMMHLLLELTGAFTRKRDIFSKELRRIKSKDDPLTVEQLETFLLMAIQHINLYAKKRHLWRESMRARGTRIFPYSLWKYYQDRRVADQRRDWEPYDAWLKFIPWLPATVRGGKVKYLHMRWTSHELEEVYNQHMRKPRPSRGELDIEIKRVGVYADKLQWRVNGGPIGELSLVEGDQLLMDRRMTWKDLDLRNYDALTQEKNAEPKASKSRNRLQHKQHDKIGAVEKARQDTETTVLYGSTPTNARKDGQARRDAQRVASYRAQQGLDNPDDSDDVDAIQDVEFAMSTDSVVDVLVPTTSSYAEDLSARLLAMAGVGEPEDN
jgi:hypothetical protein